MSLAIIDYTDSYVCKDQLPLIPTIIIICSETTLVPDSIKPILLNSISKSSIINGGIFIIRVSSDLILGQTIAQAYNEFPDSKIYTARSAIFKGIVPNFALENINLPIPKIFKKLIRPTEVSKPPENSLFEEIYSESLEKFSKTFLLIPTIRAYKFKSLKAQLKNLVDGVIASKAKRFGKIIFESESVVCAILEDLDKQLVVKNVFGNVEFDDCKLEDFFGTRKNSVFVPGSRDKVMVGAQVASQFHPSTAHESWVGSDGSLNSRPQSNPSQNKFQTPTQNFSLSSITTKDYPVCPNPQSKLPPIRPELIPKLIPLRLNENQVNLKTETKEGPNKLSSTETSKDSDVDWEVHDTKISMIIIDELGTDEVMNSIDSCLKLFRLCNRVTREYFDEKGLKVGSDDFSERVNKALKLSFDTFFIADSDKSNDQILNDIYNHLRVKLKVNKF